jgi:DNA mismatch endonuclease (patch repair protein)
VPPSPIYALWCMEGTRAEPRRLDPAMRRRVMASIRGRDTVPELTLRRALRRQGLGGYRCHTRGLPGRPDIVYARWRLAVFVDGVWWHGHPDWFHPGRRGPYWDKKISGNIARDKRVDEELRASGWDVLRIWDVDVLRCPDAAASQVGRLLREKGRPIAGSGRDG